MTDRAELEALADRYEAGTAKCVASGYAEYGSEFQRERKLIVDALRLAARTVSPAADREEVARLTESDISHEICAVFGCGATCDEKCNADAGNTLCSQAAKRILSKRATTPGGDVDAAAEYLARTVMRTSWDGLLHDGRAKDDGFNPWVYNNARQEDVRDVVREIVRLATPGAVAEPGDLKVLCECCDKEPAKHLMEWGEELCDECRDQAVAEHGEHPAPASDGAIREVLPRVADNDDGEITVTLDGRELRGWSYSTDQEHRTKMLRAREFVEGFGAGRQS